MQFEFRQSDTADEAVREAILGPLRSYNTSKAGPGAHRGLAIEILNDRCDTVGGLWGSTNYEWLFIQLLVVPTESRGNGLGRKLMNLAEAEALRRDCRAVWLDTFEFQAKPFYEKLGYVCFGELDDYPTGFTRYFMKKRLLHAESLEA